MKERENQIKILEQKLEELRKENEKMKSSFEGKVVAPKPEKTDQRILAKIYDRPLQLVVWKNLEDLRLECPDSIYLQQLFLTNFYILSFPKMTVPKWLKMINSEMIDYLENKWGSEFLPNLRETE